jgi:hypothetical protein
MDNIHVLVNHLDNSLDKTDKSFLRRFISNLSKELNKRSVDDVDDIEIVDDGGIEIDNGAIEIDDGGIEIDDGERDKDNDEIIPIKGIDKKSAKKSVLKGPPKSVLKGPPEEKICSILNDPQHPRYDELIKKHKNRELRPDPKFNFNKPWVKVKGKYLVDKEKKIYVKYECKVPNPNYLPYKIVDSGGGRPLIVENKKILPDIQNCENVNSWCDYPLSEKLKKEIDLMNEIEKEIFINHWVRSAQSEHSSIASFAQVIIELSILGSPNNFIELATSAMNDEIKHTKIALSLASYASKKQYTVDKLKLDKLEIRDKETFKKDNYRDACINEREAAKQLFYLAEQEKNKNRPELATLIIEIANDETRHADLGDKINDWLIN